MKVKSNTQECKQPKLLEQIFENSLDAILLILPSDGSILMANPAACKMFGMTEDELRQAGRNGIIEMNDTALAAFEKRNREGKITTELTYKRKDGSTFRGEFTSKIFTDADSIEKATVIIRDITEHKKTEQTLRESKERLELAQHVASLGSWEFNAKKDEAIWSKQLYDMFGLNPEKKAPNTAEYSKLICSDYSQSVSDKMEKFLVEAKLGDTVGFDYCISTPQGVTKYLHTVRMVIEVDENNRPSRITGIEQDITDRKKLEDKLLRYSKDLEALVEERTNKLKEKERLAGIGETAGMVGHDIRNPLQAIVSELYMARQAMQKGAMGAEEAVESIDFVQEQVDYITKIVQDLQDYARPLNPEFHDADLSNILVDVFSIIAVPNQIKLNVHVKGTLKIKTDSTFLKRALTNLVNNAIQAMPDGGDLTVIAYEKEKSTIITIGDTGIGIPENFKPLIFNPLMTTKAKGQGLGLAVVKRLIEALGGQVRFESQEGTGTTFTIDLPR